MRDWHSLTDWGQVRDLAPDAFDALDRMRTRALGVEIADAVASASAVTAYADQFTVDVASLTRDQRDRAADLLGDDLFAFLQRTWVNDMADRADEAWRRLFAVRPPGAGEAAAGEP